MLSLLLSIIHAIIGITIFISAWLPIPREYKIVSFFVTLAALASWLIFRRCIVWVIQKELVEGFNPKDEMIANKMKVDKRMVRFALSTLAYINLYMLGREVDVRIPTINMIILYILINRRYMVKNGC